ncbi:MAG TPA: hypothetical protein VF590_10225 [Isosphaeraceae bacterium]
MDQETIIIKVARRGLREKAGCALLYPRICVSNPHDDPDPDNPKADKLTTIQGYRLAIQFPDHTETLDIHVCDPCFNYAKGNWQEVAEQLLGSSPDSSPPTSAP